MTTEASSDEERAARLEALRQRRSGARPAPPAASHEPAAATAGPRRLTRRHHAATGGRIIAGSLSAAVALGLMAAMARGTAPSTVAQTTSPGDAAMARTVLVIRRPLATGDDPGPVAPPAVATVAAPVTTSRAS